MKWTKGLPKEEGYYWLRNDHDEETVVEVYEDAIAFIDGHPISFDELEERKTYIWTHHAGPIERPKDD